MQRITRPQQQAGDLRRAGVEVFAIARLRLGNAGAVRVIFRNRRIKNFKIAFSSGAKIRLNLLAVKHALSRSGIGELSDYSSDSKRPVSRRFGVLGELGLRGGLSAQGSEPGGCSVKTNRISPNSFTKSSV